MWLRPPKSNSRVHNALTSKFGCSSFKDIHNLIASEEAARADSGEAHHAPPGKPPIFHRNRSSNNLLRTLSQLSFRVDEVSASRVAVAREREEPCPKPEIRIPDAENTVVVYSTSLRVVRRTFEDCNAVRSILQPFRVFIDERDISMDSRFIDELKRILGISDKSKLALPRVFICGRYVGGVEEVRRLYENGDLKRWLDQLPAADPRTCEACGGIRFLVCQECNGSHKCYSEKAGLWCCTLCNENGLVRCPSCSPAPPSL